MLLVDQAGWYLAPKLELPTNISTIAPQNAEGSTPRSHRAIHARQQLAMEPVFGSYEDIIEQCCDAGKRLVKQQGWTTSIGLRDWAQELRSAKFGITRSRRSSRCQRVPSPKAYFVAIGKSAKTRGRSRWKASPCSLLHARQCKGRRRGAWRAASEYTARWMSGTERQGCAELIRPAPTVIAATRLRPQRINSA